MIIIKEKNRARLYRRLNAKKQVNKEMNIDDSNVRQTTSKPKKTTKEIIRNNKRDKQNYAIYRLCAKKT